MPCMKFLFVRPDVCRRLPSDSTSRWTPLPWAMRFPLLGLARDLHPLANAHAERTIEHVRIPVILTCFFEGTTSAIPTLSPPCKYTPKALPKTSASRFTLEGASEWLRCKALRMRAQGVYWSTWPSPNPIATKQIGYYDTPSQNFSTPKALFLF